MGAGRVGTSPGPASLAGCLTQVTQVCLAPCLACGELSAEVSRAGQAHMSGGGRPRTWGAVPRGTAVIVESGAAAWPATHQACELSRAPVLLAVPPSFSDTLELGLVLSLEQDRVALCGHERQPGSMFRAHRWLCRGTLSWPLALRPASRLSCGRGS